MNRVNRYNKAAKISESKFRAIMRCFSEDLSASQTARMTGISVRSINALFLRIRIRLAAICEAQSPVGGVVEVEEPHFGPRRVPGKHGRGAGGKTIGFGIFHRGENVFTGSFRIAEKSHYRRLSADASVWSRSSTATDEALTTVSWMWATQSISGFSII